MNMEDTMGYGEWTQETEGLTKRVGHSRGHSKMKSSLLVLNFKSFFFFPFLFFLFSLYKSKIIGTLKELPGIVNLLQVM